MKTIVLERRGNWGSHFASNGSKVLVKKFPWLLYKHKNFNNSYIKPVFENSLFRSVIRFLFGWLIENAFNKKQVFHLNEHNYAYTEDKGDTIVVNSHCNNSELELYIIEMVKELNDRMEVW